MHRVCLSLVAFVATFPATAFAWNSVGHMAVAKLA
jgi:hypothetical protein